MRREQDNHVHARSRYTTTGIRDYRNLLEDAWYTRTNAKESLNVHLPFELQHPHTYLQKRNGERFIVFGEVVKRVFGIKLYWENAPEEVYGTWALAHGQTDWAHIPRFIDLTLDVGHLMLGASDGEDAQRRIRAIIADRGNQIRHLHIHENDLLHDDHDPIGHVITPTLLGELIQGRTYIFEKGELVPEDA